MATSDSLLKVAKDLSNTLKSEVAYQTAKTLDEIINELRKSEGSLNEQERTKLSKDLEEIFVEFHTAKEKKGFFSRIFSRKIDDSGISQKLTTFQNDLQQKLKAKSTPIDKNSAQGDQGPKKENKEEKNDESKEEGVKINDRAEGNDEEQPKHLNTMNPPFINRNEFVDEFLIKRTPILELYQGHWKEQQVLIKKVVNLEENNDTLANYFIQYKLIDPVNIVQMYGYNKNETTSNELWLLFEYTPYGTVYDLIHTHKNDIEIPICLKIKMLTEVANAMKYLHSHKPDLLHRDLKSESVMIFDGFHVKVTDLINIKTLAGNVTHSANKIGSELWMAPEILLADNEDDYDDSDDDRKNSESKNKVYQYSRESDVWSFSILMYEVICRKLPFLGDVGELITKLKGIKRPIIEKKYRDDRDYVQLNELTKKCWSERFDLRPLFPKIFDELNELLQKYSVTFVQEESNKLMSRLIEVKNAQT